MTPAPAVGDPNPTPGTPPNASPPPLASRVQLCMAMGQHVSDLSAVQSSLSPVIPYLDGSGNYFSASAYPENIYFYELYGFDRIVLSSNDDYDPKSADIVTYDVNNISTFAQADMQSAATQYFASVCSANKTCAEFFSALGVDVGVPAAALYDANLAEITQMLQTPGTVAQGTNRHYTPLLALSNLNSCDYEYKGIHDWCTYLPGITVKEIQQINYVSAVLNANIGMRAAAVEGLAFSVMMASCSRDLKPILPASEKDGHSMVNTSRTGLVRGPKLTQAPCQPHNFSCMYTAKVQAGQINEHQWDQMVAAGTCSDQIAQVSKTFAAAETACTVFALSAFANIASVWNLRKAGPAGIPKYLGTTLLVWTTKILKVAGINLDVSSLTDSTVVAQASDVVSTALAVVGMVELSGLVGAPLGIALSLPTLLCSTLGLGKDVYDKAAATCAAAGYCSLLECGLCADGCCSGTLVSDFGFA